MTPAVQTRLGLRCSLRRAALAHRTMADTYARLSVFCFSSFVYLPFFRTADRIRAIPSLVFAPVLNPP